MLGAVAGLTSYTEHDAREVAIAVLEGLAHAHEARCVHRNLCPENLLLVRDPVRSPGGLGRGVKIAGWGRAKRLPEHGLLPGEACFGMKGMVESCSTTQPACIPGTYLSYCTSRWQARRMFLPRLSLIALMSPCVARTSCDSIFGARNAVG